MIRMMCGVRLVDRVSTDVYRDRVGVVVKIGDMIIQRSIKEIVGRVRKEGSGMIWLEKRGDREKWPEQIKAKIASLGQQR